MDGMTDTRFVFNPAMDDACDAEWVLIGHPNVTIQVAPYMAAHGGVYSVNEWLPAEEAMESHGPFKLLADAQAKAVEVARARA
jgi:hypothetical protein